MKQAFTLVEVIITVVILGILVSFAMPAYRVTQERALDKEAKANLKLIRAGERIYRIETDNSIYISCADTSAVNSDLKLSIPTDSPNWNYKVNVTTGPPPTFTGKAQRNTTSGRVWCIAQNTDEPYQTGCSW